MFKPLLKFTIFLALILNSRTTFSQENDPDIYKIYAKQVEQLLDSRGTPRRQQDSILKEYATLNISSNDDFAKHLAKLYPESTSNGFIFYFFNQNNLRIIFFTPGKVVETKNVTVTKEELTELIADLNEKIGISAQTKNRMPRLRGAEIINQSKPSSISLDSLISKATKLLLPSSFDTTYKHITIVPALNIGTFPFHILRPYQNSTFLIERCSFAIAPGIVDLFAKRERYLKTQRSFSDLPEKYADEFRLGNVAGFTLENPLFIGNPAYPTDSAYYFPSLPGAEKEILEATQYAKKYTLLMGKKATKDSVFTHLNNADLAYFATHGIASNKDPMNKSFIVLSGKSPYLTAKEIMNWKGKFPEMVILSACQTGLGKSMDAGMAGLARSFLLAGSHFVIMSLWNVDDEATSYLMSRFMFHLQEPSRYMPSDQLRLATMDAMKKYSKISHWASFSFFGVDWGE